MEPIAEVTLVVLHVSFKIQVKDDDCIKTQ